MMDASASAVITTKSRPKQLQSALESALAQDWSPYEVIVIVDGPDVETEAYLRGVTDHRLRVVVLPECKGGNTARNIGVEIAKGEWIAFLDDDDEWLPGKISTQMRAALWQKSPYVVICPRMEVRSPRKSRVLPLRWPEPGESIGEYLLLRRRLQGDTQIQTSSFITSRRLLQEIPWRDGLRKHQDLDLYLRWASAGVQFVFISDVLSVWNVHQSVTSVSNDQDWKYSIHWAEQNPSLFPKRTLAGFIASQVAMRAFSVPSMRTIRDLFSLLWKHGARPLDYMIAFAALVIKLVQQIQKAIVSLCCYL